MVPPPPLPLPPSGLSTSRVLKEEDETLDNPLHVFGFEYEHVSGQKISGHLRVTPQCCQLIKKTTRILIANFGIKGDSWRALSLCNTVRFDPQFIVETHHGSGILIPDLEPFKLLHGGVTAMMSESLASMGAIMACGLKRVAGIHLNINHFKSAHLGDLVYAEATPVSIGKTIQVWEVRFWNIISSIPEEKTLISSSRVTVVCNMPLPENGTDPLKSFRKYAKL